MNTRNIFSTTILLALGFFALCPMAQAVNPPLTPDPGPKPVSNTADGQNALLSITTGIHNTAIGFDSLLLTSDTSFNTAVGSATLLLNIGEENTATGAGALLSNTNGFQNTANGAFALFSNTGNGAGIQNTGIGDRALFSNTEGGGNTATGFLALSANIDGDLNTAYGDQALKNNTGGSNNTALGFSAGNGVITADHVICIGVPGADVSDSCYIGNIFGATIDPATATLVGVDANNKLGTIASSKRFKKDIKPMDKASEVLLALKPVTFQYKSDSKATPQFGLIAEEVAEVNPSLVVRDKNGEILTVRYEQVNAMLLNEFLKEHRKVEKLEATVVEQQKSFGSKLAEQEKQIEALASGLQRVRARVEVSKSATKVVSNHP